jgi:3-phosphoshikimate 1-carboxyvinyltransferase
MDYRVSKTEGLRGVVDAPPSKSYTHRAFVLASLARGESRIRDYLSSGDTMATIEACRALGAGIRIETEGSEAVVEGTAGRLTTPSDVIDCENSGTTIRLITAVSALDGTVTLTGDPSLRKRPMQPLLEALGQLGVRAVSLGGGGRPPVRVHGGELRGGEARIRGDVSSQFISALLIVSPYAREEVRITITSPLKSRPYVDMTLEAMRRFGVEAENLGYEGFRVRSGCYRGTAYQVEGDYSNASYFLALAAMTRSEITIRNLSRDSLQGDRRILDYLEMMGAEVDRGENAVTVRGGTLRGIKADLGDTPDLVPTIAALGCTARGETVIRNVEHARHKESDRIAACATEFRKLGARIRETRDGLIIRGGELKGAVVDSWGDHRLAMALTIAGMAASGETVIRGAEAVRISYPGFFEALESLRQG